MRSGAVVPRLLVATVLLVSPAAVLAEDEDDNPGRGVARISVINGDVSVRRGDSGDWVAAAVNAALVVQDTVATGPNSRAEVQFDSANVIRLGSNAEVRLSELENRRYQVQVARGPVEFSVLRDSDADVDLSTPAVSVRPSRRGRYRVNVFDGQTEVTVRSGEVEVYTPRGVERVTSGNAILVRNADSGPEFQTISATRPDELDRWSEDRDRKLERAASSYRYVSPSIYGVDDLDDHGRWVYDAPYGWVWVPSAGPGWAPYRHGRWVWQDWYGWTWVSYDPWGWAPYHWGRWYHGNYGWCWYPGDIRGRHYWRPALVAFFGFGGGGGVHVGFGFGRVGWVPLAPYEPYYPWYGRRYYGGYRGGYVDRSVNITNVNITNVYRNARVRDGLSGMDAGNFGRGRHNIVRVGDNDIRQAGLVRGQLPVAPDRGSLRFADREVRNAPRATDNNNVRFYSRRQAAPVERVPFAEQQRSFQRVSQGGATGVAAQPARTGSTDSDRGWRRGGERSGSPNANSVRSGNPGNAEGGRTWRRLGEPAHQSSAPAGASQSEPARSEVPADRGRTWRRFGEPTRPEAPVARPSETTPGTGERVGRSETERSRTWQRFGEPGAARPAEPVRRQQTAEPRRTEQVQPTERGGSDGGRGAGRSYEARPSRSEPSIRVAPQVTRERSAAPSRSVERQSSAGGGSGGRERSNSGSRGEGGSRGGGRTR